MSVKELAFPSQWEQGFPKLQQTHPTSCLLVSWSRTEELTRWKIPWCWERLRARGEGETEDGMTGWHHRLNGHGFGWILGVGDGQGGLACCGSWGCKESDRTEQLNWTELIDDSKSLPLLSLGHKDPSEKGMATHSSILAWEIPWLEASGRLQSMGSPRVRHDWETNIFTFMYVSNHL